MNWNADWNHPNTCARAVGGVLPDLTSLTEWQDFMVGSFPFGDDQASNAEARAQLLLAVESSIVQYRSRVLSAPELHADLQSGAESTAEVPKMARRAREGLGSIEVWSKLKHMLLCGNSTRVL